MAYSKRIIWTTIILFIWALLRNSFWGYIGFKHYEPIISISDKVLTVIIILYSLSEINLKKNKLVTLIIYGFIATYIYNIIAWESNLFQEFSGFIPILGIFSYFLLKKNNIDSNVAEKFLIVAAVTYLFCWFIAIVNVPNLVFGENLNGDLSNTDRGFFRFWIADKEHMPFLLFYSLWQLMNRKTAFWSICSICIYIIIILHVGRQMIIWSTLSAILMIIITYKIKYTKLLLALILIFLIGTWMTERIDGISIMAEMTIKQIENIDNDIRIHAINHYLFKYPHDILSIIWGNGIPCENTELRIASNTAFNRGFYLEDIGFVAMYIKYGLWMVILMFVLLYKILKLSVETKYIYVKYYIISIYGMYLLGHALTTNIFYVFIAYYIIEKSSAKSFK